VVQGREAVQPAPLEEGLPSLRVEGGGMSLVEADDTCGIGIHARNLNPVSAPVTT
jgi:hypothetical protein